MGYTVKVVKVVKASNFGASADNNAKEIKVAKSIEVKAESKSGVIKQVVTNKVLLHSIRGVKEFVEQRTFSYILNGKVFLILEEQIDGTGGFRVLYSK